MNRTGDPVAHVDAARDLASRIPGARFVEFPGDVHSMHAIAPERVLGEIEEFITGTRGVARADRFLATILVLDIVGSTERVQALGDAHWRDFLERYYALVRRQVATFDGVQVDTAGDGFLARFDGPTRAVRCACSIGRLVEPMGIKVRSGVHTGEVEGMGSLIRGIAVHIAARVMGQAGAGEVVASSTVKDLVAGSGIVFADRGSHHLQGIAGAWRLYKVEDDGMAQAGA